MGFTFDWIGGSKAVWNAASSWNIEGPSGPTLPTYPGAADEADITGGTASGLQTITFTGGGAAGELADYFSSLTFSGVYQFGSLVFGNTGTDPEILALANSSSSVEIGTTGGAAADTITIDSGSTLKAVGNSEIDANVANSGLLELTAGTLTLKDSLVNDASGTVEATGGSLVIAGSLDNAGSVSASNATVTVDAASTGNGGFSLDGNAKMVLEQYGTSVGNGTPGVFSFSGTSNTLVLQGLADLVAHTDMPNGGFDLGSLDGIAAGDEIDLSDYAPSPTPPLQFSGVDAQGQLVLGPLTFSTNDLGPGLQFVTLPDENGGTEILVRAVTATYTWTNGGTLAGDWNDPSNWAPTNATQPGAANSVSFNNTTATPYMLTSGGAAADITVNGQLDLVSGTYADGGTLAVGSAMDTTTGALLVESGATLTVAGDASLTNGHLFSYSSLVIDGSLTVGADEGAIATSVAATVGGTIQTGNVYVNSTGVAASDAPTLKVDGSSSITIGNATASAGTISVGTTAEIFSTGPLTLMGNVVNNGLIVAALDPLQIQGNLSGGGNVLIGYGETTNPGTLQLAGTATGGAIVFNTTDDLLDIGAGGTQQPYSVTSTLYDFAPTDTIQIDETTLTKAVWVQSTSSSGTLELYDNTKLVDSLTLEGNYTADTFSVAATGAGIHGDSSSSITISAVCYVRGTLIRTARGEVPIEHLKRGDRVATAGGGYRPVQWLGHRRVDCAGAPQPREVWPIRVAAHAFGENLPDRDLYLSPGHSVRVGCIEEALVPIVHLINGATVARHPVESVEYWHVELDEHAVILANNLPAESYIDMNNRDFFLERGIREYKPRETVLPVLHDGPMVELARQQLRARAERLGWTHEQDPQPRLWVDGTEHAPTFTEVGVAQFELPASARDVRLVSGIFVPADLTGGVGDGRTLGLSVHGIELRGDAEPVTIALDDARLQNPYGVEREAARAWRWTDGSLRLDSALWAALSGNTVTLRIRLDRSALRGYSAPPAASPGARLVAAG